MAVFQPVMHSLYFDMSNRQDICGRIYDSSLLAACFILSNNAGEGKELVIALRTQVDVIHYYVTLGIVIGT
jgi:hypothetical protein